MAMRGSVYKRCPHGTTGTGPQKPACRQKHGTWWWRTDDGRDPQTGQRRQTSQGGYSTRDEAQDALNEHLGQRASGTWADDRGKTVKVWLAEWLAEVERTLEPKTVAGYRSHVDNVLVPHLGDRRLRELRRSHVEAMIRDLQQPATVPSRATSRRVRCGKPRENSDPRPSKQRANGTPCQRWAVEGGDACPDHGGVPSPSEARPGRGGRAVEQRSGRTLDSYRRTLRAALAVAKRRELVLTNVAEGTIDAMPKMGRAETAWWQPDEVEAFLAYVAGDELAALWEVAAFAGLRRAELLGLRWEDVDLTSDHPGLTIRQTVSGLAGAHPCPVCGQSHTGRRVKPPKSAAGARWVPLVGGTIRELLAHQAAQSVLREEWGEDYNDHRLVFPMEDGTPIRPDWLSKRFDILTAEAKLPSIRLHDMRHGACSLLLAGGDTTVDTVALILGHANPSVTRGVYAHVLRAPAAAAMRAAVELVRPGHGAHSVHSTPQSAADDDGA